MFLVKEIDDNLKEKIEKSNESLKSVKDWQQVLVIINIVYISFDGKILQGEIIVNRIVQDQVINIFLSLFNIGLR
ncbi:MAG TPA: hypothetical protein QKA14_01680 [Candidatus Megaira endosymbiont of Hartmannula sinica]|nr:hypothetical protein [Candidatus Megaera endosymbiont of Hartmannula sinica]